MITLSQTQIRALPNDRLVWLQQEYPPITNDVPNPENQFRFALFAEGRRRGMW